MGRLKKTKTLLLYATIWIEYSKRGLQSNIMRIAHLTFSILLVLTLGILPSYGQSPMSHSKKFTDNWFINGNVGISQFYGDMSEENPFQKILFDTRIGTGLVLGKMITPYLGVRGEIHYAKLKSTRKYLSYNPNGEYFVAWNLIELNLAANINFVNLIFGYNSRRVVTAYGIIGAGLTNWQTELYDFKTNQKIRDNGYNGNGILNMTTEFVMPFGAGINFKVHDHIDVNVETTWRGVNSDKLDTKVGGFKYDIYTYSSVGITYKFNLVKSKTVPVPEEEEDTPLIYEKQEDELIDTDIPEPVVRRPIEIVEEPEEQITEEYDELPLVEDVPEIEFRVQIRASYSKPIPPDEILSFGVPDRIREELSDGWYRYTVGSFDNITDASDYRSLVRNSYGISDAFVVAYVKGERLKSLRYLDGKYTAEGFNVLEEKVDNIRYGVQIAASYLVQIPITKLQETYSLDEPIREDIQDGWYRYSVGSFDQYWKAKEHRNILLTRNNAQGSFVIAFKDEIRYTIVELLGLETRTASPTEVIGKPRRNVVFKVQLLVLDPAVQISADELKAQYNIREDIQIVNENGLVKYQIGNLNSYEDACLLRDQIVGLGVKDAFVVPYENGRKIHITEAFDN